MHQARVHLTHLRERGMWKEHVSREKLARGLRPPGGECGLQLGHRRTFESHVRLAPLIFVVTVPEPVVGEAESASVSYATIDDNQAHVRSLRGLLQSVPSQWSQPDYLDTGSLQTTNP